MDWLPFFAFGDNGIYEMIEAPETSSCDRVTETSIRCRFSYSEELQPFLISGTVIITGNIVFHEDGWAEYENFVITYNNYNDDGVQGNGAYRINGRQFFDPELGGRLKAFDNFVIETDAKFSVDFTQFDYDSTSLNENYSAIVATRFLVHGLAESDEGDVKVNYNYVAYSGDSSVRCLGNYSVNALYSDSIPQARNPIAPQQTCTPEMTETFADR